MTYADTIAGLVADGKIPGAALRATRNGEVIAEQAWGDGDVSRRYPFLSFTKGVTTTVIHAVQTATGAWQWHDPVISHIPEMAGGKEQATVAHLLTHALGAPTASEGIGTATAALWDQAVAAICAAPAEWPPGSRTAYHGWPGHLLAAELCRRVTGKTWSELVDDHVRGPLGLDTMSFDRTGVHMPAGFDLAEIQGHPSGGMAGTLADITAVLEHHLADPSRYAEMHRLQYRDQIEQARAAGQPPTHETWGLGWLLRGTNEADWPTNIVNWWFGLGAHGSPATFSHAGGASCLGIADPATGVAVAVVATETPETMDAVTLRTAASELLGIAVS